WREAAPAGVVVTSVDRDGTLLGPDLRLLSEVRSRTVLPVTYSGGIASLEDLRAVSAAGAAAVILGRSLLAGIINLEEALSGGGPAAGGRRVAVRATFQAVRCRCGRQGAVDGLRYRGRVGQELFETLRDITSGGPLMPAGEPPWQ